MKKIYLVALALCTGFASHAQFTDDIESYDSGPVYNARWTTWDGTDTDAQKAIVTLDQAFEGNKSIVIGPDSGGQDAILDLEGLRTSGVWSIAWKMYVPSGNTGYFNLQGNVSPNANANLEFLTGNITLVGGTLADDSGGDDLTYPESQWFDFSAEIDLDNATYELKIDGSSSGLVDITGVSGFGGADFFADSATNTYYIDVVRFAEGVLGADDFSADVFTVYPNPVVDVLSIRSAATVDNVTIYDVLGKQVLSVNPDNISPSVDMSKLSSGAYLVNITIGDASKTIKVLK